MTQEENIFLAKKLFTELVFNTAYIEGVNVTFPQTQTILEGGLVRGVPVSEIQTVLNLRDAWKFCLNSLSQPLTLDYVCRVNECVSRNESLDWGHLRTGAVNISGTEYVPPIPTASIATEHITEIAGMDDAKEAAKDLFCYIVRSQLFWDGNKRTATIAANHLLIASAQGVLTIGKAEAQDFNEALLHYYDTADSAPLKQCLDGCIKVMERYAERTPLEQQTQDNPRMTRAEVMEYMFGDAQRELASMPEQGQTHQQSNELTI